MKLQKNSFQIYEIIEDFRIPGTNVILESGDRIKILEKEISYSDFHGYIFAGISDQELLGVQQVLDEEMITYDITKNLNEYQISTDIEDLEFFEQLAQKIERTCGYRTYTFKKNEIVQQELSEEIQLNEFIDFKEELTDSDKKVLLDLEQDILNLKKSSLSADSSEEKEKIKNQIDKVKEKMQSIKDMAASV